MTNQLQFFEKAQDLLDLPPSWPSSGKGTYNELRVALDLMDHNIEVAFNFNRFGSFDLSCQAYHSGLRFCFTVGVKGTSNDKQWANLHWDRCDLYASFDRANNIIYKHWNKEIGQAKMCDPAEWAFSQITNNGKR